MSRTAVVMAGGEGRRLQPYTTVLPKPLLPVGERSVLEIVLRQLGHHGFTNIVLAVGYLAEIIEAFVGNGKRFGVEVSYVRESGKLGTAGPISNIGGLPDSVLVVNGDVLTDIDFARLVESHIESNSAATLAVVARTHEIEFGVIERDADGMLTRFTEKPADRVLISTGINVLSAEAIARIPKGETYDIPDLANDLLKAGLSIGTYEIKGTWLDIGRPADLERALGMLDANPDRFLPVAPSE